MLSEIRPLSTYFTLLKMFRSSVMLSFVVGMGCLLCESSVTAELSPCSNGSAPDSGQLVVRCSFLGLDALPKQIYNENIVELDLSGNHFTTLGPSSFRGLKFMKKLNISKCGIEQLFSDTFEGLVSLKELDMKNNHVIAGVLPDALFDDLPQLERLYVSGYVISTDVMTNWGNLNRLQEIIFTPGRKDNFTQLARLPNLHSVYFVSCHFGNSLKQYMLRAFRNSTITELAFVSCHLTDIEDGTFDDLLSLDVLNLAGNTELSIDRIIDVLSTNRVNVSTLILDCVGSYNHIFMAGLRESPSCRSAWTNLRRLSIRGINMVAILEPMRKCLPNLQALAAGFNTISKCGGDTATCWDIVIYSMPRLQYLDLSYFMPSDSAGLATLTGYKGTPNWITLNDDYFPSLNLSKDCSSKIGNTSIGNCKFISLFQCLSYIKCNHSFTNIFYGASECGYLVCSNLKYLNISSRSSVSHDLITLDINFYGLEKLSILDLSGFDILSLNLKLFQHFISLEQLDLSRNQLGKGGNQEGFPLLRKLSDLNLADNYYTSFPHEFFVKLTSLRRLVLSDNQLIELRFALPLTLEYLDISRNRLTLLEPDDRLLLDQHPGLLLKMDDNPLQCDCPETAFIKWYQQRASQISNWQTISCTKGTSTHRINEINVERLQLACGLTVNRVVLTICICVVAIMITASFLVGYRYRWLIRWKYYKYRYRQHRTNENILLRSLNKGSRYSCYVIFPYDDDDTRHWVQTVLIPLVEYELHKPPMFVKGRDEHTGQPCIDEIVRGIMESQTALWIVCPGFYQDNYCEMAAHFALRHFRASDNLLVILENQLNRYSAPKIFAAIMHPDIGLSRIRFKDDDTVRRLFSAKLDSFLPAV